MLFYDNYLRSRDRLLHTNFGDCIFLFFNSLFSIENMDGGTQIKLLFYLKDGGKAVFKPMRYC